MKADITRRSYRPERHYSRTIYQQGRVGTDADGNEQIAIQEHRDRAEAVDVIGPVGVPKGPSFAVAATPGGTDLHIRPGRLWVDGLLCENEGDSLPVIGHGAASVTLPALTVDGRPLRAGEWVAIAISASDARLFQIAGLDLAAHQLALSLPGGAAVDLTFLVDQTARLRRAVSYAAQPDLPQPPLTAAGPPRALAGLSDGQYGLYLDVWERHITALDDPAIREVALGGPDTRTRARTVWQARLTRVGDLGETISCDAVLPTPLPRGRLAARAELGDLDKPCLVAPAAGYRRLENQLYRVEIHTPGELGTATFKFSRENGSVVAGWSAQSGSDLTLESAGPDRNLGFAAGQWIELVDDERDLTATPGTLVQIAKVVGPVITVDGTTAVAPGLAKGDPAAYAIARFGAGRRVRRWDHATTDAAIVVEQPVANDGFIALEDGVEVRFTAGRYETGDHWTIPARALLGDLFDWPKDVDGAPLAVAAEGIAHHIAPLAIVSWQGGQVRKVDDCRAQFPPLTHLCAEDVCVEFPEGSPCAERDIKTVQDALDHLCQEHDLEFHNQHLHGWGVVCGLQVHCLKLSDVGEGHDDRNVPIGETVKVETGYAIHPTGADIRFDKKALVEVGDLAVEAGLTSRDDSGKLKDVDLSLWVDRDKRFHLEAYDPKSKQFAADSLLQGTVLWDFYDHCLKGILDFFKGQFQAGPAGDIVPVGVKRGISLLNLFWQLLQPAGRAIYLSGDGEVTEHDLLKTFFEALRALLQSDTFCAMFSDIVFPDYDVYRDGLPENAERPTTIFGKLNFHTRLRVSPDGRWAVTCGNGAKIALFDLTTNKLVQEVPFPAGSAEVMDVAFGPTAAGVTEVYATAVVGSDQDDSIFAVGSLSKGQLSFGNGGSQINCGALVITLGTSANSPGKVWAAARGKGLLEFSVALATPTAAPKLLAQFYSTGHLVVADDDRRPLLYAGAHDQVTNPVAYNHVYRYSPTGQDSSAVQYDLGAEGSDGFDVGLDPKNKVQSLFVVVAGQGGARRLITADALDPKPALSTFKSLDLEDNTATPIGYNPKSAKLFCAYADAFQGRLVEPQQNHLMADVHPLQIAPVSVAVPRGGGRYYVLNWMSNTITSIPTETTTVAGVFHTTIDLTKLRHYRQEAITAFLKVAGRFLQYLKDCFCDLLLVDCPDPKGKKVYLADIAIKNGVIHKICNFTRRRYVHTFPTVEYWMSIVPLLPLLKRAVANFCCAVIPGFFDNLKQPERTFASGIRLSSGMNALSWVKAANVRQAASKQVFALSQAANTSKIIVADALQEKAPGRVAPAPAPAPAPGQSPGNVARVVESKGGNVTGQKALSPIDGIFEAFRFAVAPRQVKPGAQVELLTDAKGNVVGYQPIAEVRIEKTIEKTVERVVERAGPEVAMKADLEALSGKLAEREQLVAKLSTELAELQRRSSEDTVRKADFEALSRKLADRESVITKLATDFNELQRRHAEELKSLGSQMNEFGRLLRERPPR